MRVLRFLLTLMFLTGFVGWAQDAPATAPQAGDAKPSKATVYIYRYKQFVGSALSPSVYCDDNELARIENGRYFSATIDPGKHSFRSNDKQSGVELGMKAGEQYFIRVEIAAGFMKGHGRLVLMSPQQAGYELKSTNLKPSDPGKVVDKDRVSVEAAHIDTPAATPKAPESATAVAKPPQPENPTPSVKGTVIVDNDGAMSPASQTGEQTSLGEAARRARLKKASSTTTTQDPAPQK